MTTYAEVIEFLEHCDFKCDTRARYISPTIQILKKKQKKE